MPKERCWTCKKLKSDVSLRACEDRLCEDCFEKNEAALRALRAADVSHLSDLQPAAVSALVVADTSPDLKVMSSSCEVQQVDAGPANIHGGLNDSIVVNELLCYVFNKIDVLPLNDLVKIVIRFYSDSEVDLALSILLSIDLVKNVINNRAKRMSKHRGPDKKLRNAEDICKLILDITSPSDSEVGQCPEFYAKDLSRLPFVDTDFLDVSTISQQIHQMQIEIQQLSCQPHDLSPSLSDLKVELCQMRSDIQLLSSRHLSDMSVLKNDLDMRNGELQSQVSCLTNLVTSLSTELKNISDNIIRPVNDSSCGLNTPSDASLLVLAESPVTSMKDKMPDTISATVSASHITHMITEPPAEVSAAGACCPVPEVLASHGDDRSHPPSQTASNVGTSSLPYRPDTVNHLVLNRGDHCHAPELKPDGDMALMTSIPADDDDFETVQRRRKHRNKQKLVIGSGSIPSSLRSLQPISSQTIQQSASMFVSRLPSAATEEDLTEYVNSVFKVKSTCVKLVSGRFHTSFKVTVSAKDIKRLYDGSKWPELTLVRRFYDHGTQSV